MQSARAKAKAARRSVEEARRRLEARLHPVVVGPGVILRLGKDDAGWLKVLIEVGSDATHGGLREAIPLALLRRDYIEQVQPSRAWRDRLLWNLWGEHINGTTHNQIAEMLNRRIERALRLERRYGPPASGSARDLLIALGYDDEEIEEVTAVCLPQEHLDTNRREDPPPLFSRHYPIWPEKVRSALRMWQRRHGLQSKRQRPS